MRQVELYRQNPAVGLLPPPHPLTLFLREYKLVILDTGIAIFFLVSGFWSRGPLTRLSVFNIAAGIGFLLLALTVRMVEDVYQLLGRIVGVLEGHAKILDVATQTVGALTKATGILADSFDPKDGRDKNHIKK
jgi:hypothetical protein